MRRVWQILHAPHLRRLTFVVCAVSSSFNGRIKVQNMHPSANAQAGNPSHILCILHASIRELVNKLEIVS